jgi:transposase InsO family protein
LSISQLAEEARNHQRYAATATDALLVRVALPSRLARARGVQPAGRRGCLRSEPGERLSALASLPRGRLGGACRPSVGAEARQPRRLSRELEQRILHAREYAKAGPLIVASQLGLPASTVWKVLRRYGVSRLRRPARGPVARYERSRPGELVHVDIKKLGRFWTVGKRIYEDGLHRNRRAGWQYLHLAIDDHSRLAYAELLPSESPADCVAFLRRAVAWYGERGISVERVLSDNGNGYRSFAWRAVCAELGIARRYTRPRRPQTNGKAEALIKTLLREWAYRFAYPTSAHRARALPGYLRWYNRHRPHSSLAGRPPISRVSQVCGSHT